MNTEDLVYQPTISRDRSVIGYACSGAPIRRGTLAAIFYKAKRERFMRALHGELHTHDLTEKAEAIDEFYCKINEGNRSPTATST